MSNTQSSDSNFKFESAPKVPADADATIGPLDDTLDDDSCSEKESPEIDEDDDKFDENVHAVIGVSISRAQTRLTSPDTPAAEKAQALDRDAESFPFDGPDDPSLQSSSTSSYIRDNDQIKTRFTRSTEAFPVLDNNESRESPNLDGACASHRVSERSNRFRAATGPDRGIKKLGPFSIPRSFDASRLSISNLSSWLSGSEGGQSSPSKSKRHSVGFFGFMSSKTSTEAADEQQADTAKPRSQWTGEDLSLVTTEPKEVMPEPGLLRRSTSDTSLYLRRALSHASSLGDDSRWHNVHGQVNSRFKALRDSLQDSSLKLPRMPNLSGFSLSSPLKPPSPDPATVTDSITNQRGLSVPSQDTLNPLSAVHEARKPSGAFHSKSPTHPHPKHPHLTNALRDLEGDVVILGGYRGSILRSAEPPNRQLWVPIKVGLNIRKVNLEVGLESNDDEKMTDTIIPSGMLQHIGPVDISRRLFKHLRQSPNVQSGKLRVWDYGYDWRLNPHHLSDCLIKFLESLPSNSPDALPHERGATVIAHSLGGLITRHAINRKPHLFSGVLYAGTPQTCVNILGPLRNGDDVLLSSKVLTAQVNFTIRTSYALLPLDGKCFFNPETKEEYPVDFFDVRTWEEFCLSPCISRPVPAVTQPVGMVGNLVNSMASVLPSITVSRRGSISKRKSTTPELPSPASPITPANPLQESNDSAKESKRDKISNYLNHTMSYQMEMPTAPKDLGHASESGVSTAVTIPKAEAVAYLIRTLADIKRFKEELEYNASHDAQGLYPPATVIYGKSVPTVYGARVVSREAIKQTDAFDNLAFASGDGVVLARASQLPRGYQLARGGCISSSRGHVSLLGDLEAVGKCLVAIRREKRRRLHEDPGNLENVSSKEEAEDIISEPRGG